MFSSLVILFISCQKEDLTHSCNPDVDKWVKSNYTNILEMNRSDIIKYDDETQRAIFSAFPADRRYKLWIEKFDQVLGLDWECNEVAHIEKLRDEMNIDWFDDNVKENDEKIFHNIDAFIKEWCEFGMAEFEWSRDQLGWMVATLNDMAKRPGPIGGGLINNIQKKDCDCSISSDWCPSIGFCKDTKCETSSWGCGTLFFYKCTGECKLW